MFSLLVLRLIFALQRKHNLASASCFACVCDILSSAGRQKYLCFLRPTEAIEKRFQSSISQK